MLLKPVSAQDWPQDSYEKQWANRDTASHFAYPFPRTGDSRSRMSIRSARAGPPRESIPQLNQAEGRAATPFGAVFARLIAVKAARPTRPIALILPTSAPAPSRIALKVATVGLQFGLPDRPFRAQTCTCVLRRKQIFRAAAIKQPAYRSRRFATQIATERRLTGREGNRQRTTTMLKTRSDS